MPNQYVNKVVINDQTRIDLTGDTVTADKLMQGYTAHDRSGAPITGTHDDLTAEPLSVTENGTYTAPAGKAYTPVTVAVPSPGTQTRTATPSLSTQSITPDSGNLLSKVTVNPITAQLLASLDADFVAGNIKKDVDLFGLIGTFEGGGGGETKIASGDFIPAEDISVGTSIAGSYYFDTGLGYCPKYFALYDTADDSNIRQQYFMCILKRFDGSSSGTMRGAQHAFATDTSGYGRFKASAATANIGSGSQARNGIVMLISKSSSYLRAGRKYHWIAIGECEI